MLRSREIWVPNGRKIWGYSAGESAVTLLEHALRDELAEKVNGATEASLGYGRADVLTADVVFEVEPVKRWRHAVRQALQYSAQTGCQPAIAIFGAASPEEVLALHLKLRDGHPRVELWWYTGTEWLSITSRARCMRRMREPEEIGTPATRRMIRKQAAEEQRAAAEARQQRQDAHQRKIVADIKQRRREIEASEEFIRLNLSIVAQVADDPSIVEENGKSRGAATPAPSAVKSPVQ